MAEKTCYVTKNIDIYYTPQSSAHININGDGLSLIEMACIDGHGQITCFSFPVEMANYISSSILEIAAVINGETK